MIQDSALPIRPPLRSRLARRHQVIITKPGLVIHPMTAPLAPERPVLATKSSRHAIWNILRFTGRPLHGKSARQRPRSDGPTNSVDRPDQQMWQNSIEPPPQPHFDEFVTERPCRQRYGYAQNHKGTPQQPAVDAMLHQSQAKHLQREKRKGVDEIKAVTDLAAILQERCTERRRHSG